MRCLLVQGSLFFHFLLGIVWLNGKVKVVRGSRFYSRNTFGVLIEGLNALLNTLEYIHVFSRFLLLLNWWWLFKKTWYWLNFIFYLNWQFLFLLYWLRALRCLKYFYSETWWQSLRFWCYRWFCWLISFHLKARPNWLLRSFIILWRSLTLLIITWTILNRLLLYICQITHLRMAKYFVVRSWLRYSFVMNI